MKNSLKRVLAIAGACLLTMGSLTACGSNKDASKANSDAAGSSVENTVESSTDNVQLSGTIQMVGSTSMEKLANALAESFMEKYPGVTVGAEVVGSSAGVEAVIGGIADIGNSSRNLKDAEKEAGAVENVVAIDGIAVCLDPANTVTDLSKQQLIDIYTGAVTNWNELGGTDTPIVVVGREASSGTRGAFEELLEVEELCVYANELDSTGAVIAKVASTPGAIGYASLDAIDDTVIPASLEGVAPTVENIKGGSYFLSRPFVMATKGEISEQSELVQAWFEYVLSTEGQEVATIVGLITVE